MRLLPGKPLTVKKAKLGLDWIEKFYDNVKIRNMLGWGRWTILLVTGTPKKKNL
jgi:hypothetical protein